jgi:hypothetical protein
VNSFSRIPPRLAETAPRQKPALLLGLYEFLLRAVIPKALVWEAFQRVKANGGGAGVDIESIEAFEKSLGGNSYKLGNRMGSGSYFPPPVKAVPIPKKGGYDNRWALPTVADRVAQTVVKLRPNLRSTAPVLDPTRGSNCPIFAQLWCSVVGDDCESIRHDYTGVDFWGRGSPEHKVYGLTIQMQDETMSEQNVCIFCNRPQQDAHKAISLYSAADLLTNLDIGVR